VEEQGHREIWGKNCPCKVTAKKKRKPPQEKREKGIFLKPARPGRVPTKKKGVAGLGKKRRRQKKPKMGIKNSFGREKTPEVKKHAPERFGPKVTKSPFSPKGHFPLPRRKSLLNNSLGGETPTGGTCKLQIARERGEPPCLPWRNSWSVLLTQKKMGRVFQRGKERGCFVKQGTPPPFGKKKVPGARRGKMAPDEEKAVPQPNHRDCLKKALRRGAGGWDTKEGGVGGLKISLWVRLPYWLIDRKWVIPISFNLGQGKRAGPGKAEFYWHRAPRVKVPAFVGGKISPRAGEDVK